MDIRVPRIVYKSLNNGAIAPVTMMRWPLPKDGKPGAWVEVDGYPKLCERGLHGWLTVDDALKYGDAVYEMEIAGEVVEDDRKVAATKARLLRLLHGTMVTYWTIPPSVDYLTVYTG